MSPTGRRKLQAKLDATGRYAECGYCGDRLGRLDETRRPDGTLLRRQLALLAKFHKDTSRSGAEVWRAANRGRPRKPRRTGPTGQGGVKKDIRTRTTPEGLEMTHFVYRGPDGESSWDEYVPGGDDRIECPHCKRHNVLDSGVLRLRQGR